MRMIQGQQGTEVGVTGKGCVWDPVKCPRADTRREGGETSGVAARGGAVPQFGVTGDGR